VKNSDKLLEKLKAEAWLAYEEALEKLLADTQNSFADVFTVSNLLPDPAFGFVFPRFVRAAMAAFTEPISNFFSRLKLIPARIVGAGMAYGWPQTPKMTHRVVTLDGALRQSLLIMARVGIDDIATLGPQSMDWWFAQAKRLDPSWLKFLRGKLTFLSWVDSFVTNVVVRCLGWMITFITLLWQIGACILAVAIMARFAEAASNPKEWTFSLGQKNPRQNLFESVRKRVRQDQTPDQKKP